MSAPSRPQQRPGAQGGAAGTAQRPTAPGERPAQGRPTAPGQRPGQNDAGLIKPAPKAKVRRARLLVSKVDPWSVLKMAFLLSVALGIVTVVAAIVLWTVLDLTGIFDQVDSLLGTLAGSEGGGFELKKVASLGQVASFATILAVINVVLLTALSMLSAVLYNISATLVGGIGVTLTDD
ncbi:putative membrane protein [Arthrobacter sp. UYEF20]